jgi:hypothetical protein
MLLKPIFTLLHATLLLLSCLKREDDNIEKRTGCKPLFKKFFIFFKDRKTGCRQPVSSSYIIGNNLKIFSDDSDCFYPSFQTISSWLSESVICNDPIPVLYSASQLSISIAIFCLSGKYHT